MKSSCFLGVGEVDGQNGSNRLDGLDGMVSVGRLMKLEDAPRGVSTLAVLLLSCRVLPAVFFLVCRRCLPVG